uniref:DUF4102 domain-containing protein n=1 Tax=Macrostomum lignano TaxID=282301 RepID=A0A1I8F456_9PLAT
MPPTERPGAALRSVRQFRTPGGRIYAVP